MTDLWPVSVFGYFFLTVMAFICLAGGMSFCDVGGRWRRLIWIVAALLWPITTAIAIVCIVGAGVVAIVHQWRELGE